MRGISLILVIVTTGFFNLEVSAQIKEEFLTDSSSVRVLKGTLLNPKTSEKKYPLVLIIAGSGPTDRDGNGPTMKSDYLKLLAENFAASGIASFRYDKRGVGKSKIPNLKEKDLVFQDFSGDAEAWIKRFKRDTRFSKIIVLGHSEGSLVGMLSAKAAQADGFISLAGAGRPIDVILKEQLQANPYNPEQLRTDAGIILDSLKAGFQVKKINQFLVSIFRPSVQPFLISWMQLDPAVELSKLKVSCMIVQGSTDIQVSVTDAEKLKKAKPQAQYLIVEGMNHVLRDAPVERMENAATYTQFEKPLSAGLTPALVSFIHSIK
jgi:uncharacterized protein